MNHRSGITHPPRAFGWGPAAWQRQDASQDLTLLLFLRCNLTVIVTLLLSGSCGRAGVLRQVMCSRRMASPFLRVVSPWSVWRFVIGVV
jgi:hypothetical protein